MNDIVELNRMWSTARALSPEFISEVCNWLDQFDHQVGHDDDALADIVPDEFAMYCMAAL